MHDTEALQAKLSRLRAKLAALPKAKIGHFPTPLDECPRLSAELGTEFQIKRDDCTGVAFGGNKSRQHQYILGYAMSEGYDTVIQGAASQSNHSRQLSAAGAKLGLEVHIIAKQDKRSKPVQGNYLVTNLLEPNLHKISMEESMIEAKAHLAEQLRAEGKKPYTLGMGADESLILAAVAYVECYVEIIEQCLSEGSALPDYIFATSQGATQAGLQLGAMYLGLPTKVIGINPMTSAQEAHTSDEEIVGFLLGAAKVLDIDIDPNVQIVNDESYVGPGYAEMSDLEVKAQKLLAQTEGILVDPTYSGKGLSGAFDYITRGVVKPGEKVVFVHTGGLPAIFAFNNEIVSSIEGE